MFQQKHSNTMIFNYTFDSNIYYVTYTHLTSAYV